MKRILHIVGNLEKGGIQANLMNYYRNIDTQKVQFDIVVHKKVFGFEEEFKELGGGIFYLPTMKEIGIYNYVKKIQEIIRTNGPYHGVHSHLMYQTGFILLAAKRENVNLRISHAHTSATNSKFYKITKPLWKLLIKMTATKLIACSKEAGYFLYGNVDFEVLPNALNYNEFKGYDKNEVLKLKSELNIGEKHTTIGHIGRFVEVKNHKYLIKILKKLVEQDKNVKLVLVGEGPLLPFVKSLVQSEKLTNNVIFMGIRDDINVVLNLCDVFVLPSFFEGFGIVVLEAQVMGVNCIVSDSITRSVDLGLGLVNFQPLESIDNWVDSIKNNKSKGMMPREIIDNHMNSSLYNIINAKNLLYRIYGVENKSE